MEFLFAVLAKVHVEMAASQSHRFEKPAADRISASAGAWQRDNSAQAAHAIGSNVTGNVLPFFVWYARHTGECTVKS